MLVCGFRGLILHFGTKRIAKSVLMQFKSASQLAWPDVIEPIEEGPDTLIVAAQQHMLLRKSSVSRVCITRDGASKILKDLLEWNRTITSHADTAAARCYNDLMKLIEHWERRHGRGSALPWRRHWSLVGRYPRLFVEVIWKQSPDTICIELCRSSAYFLRWRFRSGSPLTLREANDLLRNALA